MKNTKKVQSELPVMKLIRTGKDKGKLLMNKVLYTGFLIGKLPNKFAYIYSEEKDNEGHTQWFNFKGLTYIHIPESPWS